MLGDGIMFSHVAFYIARAAEGLAFEANPILCLIFTFMALEFREVLRVFVEEELGKIFDFLVVDVRTVQFGLDGKACFFRGIQRH
jgi:hypothetical protein